jgi:hypothetical protein
MDGGRWTYIATADVLDEVRVEIRLLDDLLQQGVYQEVQLGVLEAALSGLSQGRPYGEGNDHIVGVLGGAGRISKRRKAGMEGEHT